MKKKITIVVADGRVESVFADEELEVEIVDFDDDFDEYEVEESKADYIDQLRETKVEVVC